LLRWILPAGLLLPGALPAIASGHAALLNSNPAPGTRLERGPAQITLDFTEPLNGGLSTAKLIDTGSGTVIPATVSSSERQLTLTPQARPGKAIYRVDWHLSRPSTGTPSRARSGSASG